MLLGENFDNLIPKLTLKSKSKKDSGKILKKEKLRGIKTVDTKIQSSRS